MTASRLSGIGMCLSGALTLVATLMNVGWPDETWRLVFAVMATVLLLGGIVVLVRRSSG